MYQLRGEHLITPRAFTRHPVFELYCAKARLQFIQRGNCRWNVRRLGSAEWGEGDQREHYDDFRVLVIL